MDSKQILCGIIVIWGCCVFLHTMYWYSMGDGCRWNCQEHPKYLATYQLAYETISSTNKMNMELKKRTKNIGRKYSVITASLPDFANDTVYIDKHGRQQGSDRAWGYAFNLPCTAMAWKRFGFETLAIMTVDKSKIDDKARALWRYIDKALRHVGATPIYFDVPSHMKSRLGQVLRVAVGEIAQTVGLDDNDFIITGDADYWPLLKSRYDIQEDKDVLIANAWCCSSFRRQCQECIQGVLYRMYPMCNIGMKAHKWRAIMGNHLNVISGVHTTNFTYKHIKPMMTRIKEFEGSNYKNLFNTMHGSSGWFLDQYWISVQLGNYFYRSGYGRAQLEPKPPLPCVRIDGEGLIPWETRMKAYEKGEIKCFRDAHVFKTHPYAPNNWRQLKTLAVKLFDIKSISNMERYATVFHKALQSHVFKELEFK